MEDVANELKNLVDKINSTIRSERVKRVALTTTLAIHKPRIFVKGQDASGGTIGQYGTNPISISKKAQARNTGKTYFKGGYAQYKSAIGKNPGYVNLQNTGQEMMDYGIVFNGSDFGFGFQNSLNADKAGWHTEKYNKEIFALSDSELDVHGNVLVDQISKAL